MESPIKHELELTPIGSVDDYRCSEKQSSESACEMHSIDYDTDNSMMIGNISLAAMVELAPTAAARHFARRSNKLCPQRRRRAAAELADTPRPTRLSNERCARTPPPFPHAIRDTLTALRFIGGAVTMTPTPKRTHSHTHTLSLLNPRRTKKRGRATTTAALLVCAQASMR